jgi:catechol 2,3-dioxygenase-like lactoylglutathione lyase family enzyme
MFSKVFHFNLNVCDLDRSISFYRGLGFVLIGEATPEGPELGAPLGLKVSKFRAAFMRLAGQADGPILDLLQFLEPPHVGDPYTALNNIGICRIAFRVEDFAGALETLQAQAIPLQGPAVEMVGPGGEKVVTACFRDPDGIALQLFGKLG